MSESASENTPNVLDSPTIVLENFTTKENIHVNERDVIISEIPTSEPDCTRRILQIKNNTPQLTDLVSNTSAITLEEKVDIAPETKTFDLSHTPRTSSIYIKLTTISPLPKSIVCRPDFSRAFETERYILNILGAYPEISNPSSWSLIGKILYFSIGIIQFTSVSITLFISNDFNTLLDCLIFFINESNLLCKIFLLYKTRNILEELRLYIKNIDDSNIPDDLRDTLAQREIIRSRIGTVYRLAIFWFILVQIFIVLFQEEKKFVPMLSWTPFDLKDPLAYYLVVIFQLGVTCTSSVLDTSADCLYCTLADVACCQLDILNENIRRLDPKDPMIETQMSRNIKYHQDIIRFVYYIEVVFSNILFLEFFKSVIEICFTGFELTVMEMLSLKFFMQIIYFIGMFLEIFAFCWFGHLLETKSTEVEDACYMFNWDESSKTVQKMLQIMMIRAHKPLAVKAIFLKLSMATLTAILRSSYSYAAVLRSFYI
ncbi:odorant receptor 67a-like [Diabrotica undecimpunctata]|uniref:odorant receptor 67a-like n=1 Tax=Diabrotica undecimpunctata TaxID=50387 RepID=UPI003B634A39